MKPKAADVRVHFAGVLWVPYLRDDKGRLRALSEPAAG